MSVRKLWQVRWSELPYRKPHRVESKVKAYAWVQAQAANWQCGAVRSPHLGVWGWRLYERIDLRTWDG